MFHTIMGLIKKLFGDYSSRELKSIYPIVDKIEAMAEEYKRQEAARVEKSKNQPKLENLLLKIFKFSYEVKYIVLLFNFVTL